MRKTFCFIIICHFSLLAFSQSQKTFSSSEILLQLKKLNVLGSVLYIGAHPDDENNALLPYLANEKLYRTAYLSLTRGDGGQNLIGEEQGVELGLIRTQELLAARKIDGAEQYFTRAYEFGYSKTSEETLGYWKREKILSDMVWVIRKYQPDIIIKRFPPDARAGHGHHAASAILADEAFIVAADPNRFTDQFKHGVKPWSAKRIMWNTFNFGANNTTSETQLKIDIGGYNSLLGKSYGEMGGDARTMHKSQGEGRPRNRGQSIQYFVTTGGDVAISDLMDGVVTDWKRMDGSEAIQKLINQIIDNYKADHPELSVTALVQLHKNISALPENIWRDKKLSEVQQIIEACSGLFVEATTSQKNVVQGDTLRVNIVINKRNSVNASLKKISLENFDSSFTNSLITNQNFVITKTLSIADDKKISQPYWLLLPVTGSMFQVADQTMIGKAENDPSFEASFVVNIEGAVFIVKRAVQHRIIDPVKGDLYQPVAVLPKVELRFTKDNFLSINNAPLILNAKIKSTGKNATKMMMPFIQHSEKWKSTQAVFTVGPYENQEQDWSQNFVAVGKEINITEQVLLRAPINKYDSYTKTISYDHIPTITYFPKAQANLVKVDLKITGKKIGYIIGAGDKVPEALQAMGYEVITLSENDITENNLKQFDAIITGIRAHNIFPYLTQKNDILNRYVENGGNLIVQYLKSNQVGNMRIKVGPYPFVIDAAVRVTEEDAKVNFLLPDHAVLNYPNKITDKDFDGWVQERSTYQAVQLDKNFETPLGMNDKDAAQTNGSLAIAKYGKGNFIYASLVFFRQLPAGVPGAYRLMANLIALGKK